MSFFLGFLMGLTLIVAIGAQNVFVLRQGLRRELVGTVIVICALSDTVLILFGVAGLGRVLESAPWLVDAARWGGAAFLLGYAALAARRALGRSSPGLVVEERGTKPIAAGPLRTDSVESLLRTRTRTLPVVATALALTWLNPHVYLDTVFLLGSVAATHGDDRWMFAGGAVLGSLVWFTALGVGARHLGRWLASPLSWRILDGVIAAIMAGLAVMLLHR